MSKKSFITDMKNIKKLDYSMIHEIKVGENIH